MKTQRTEVKAAKPKTPPCLRRKIFFHAAMAGIGAALLTAGGALGAVLCALLADGRPLDGRYLLGILSGVLLGVLFAFFSARYSSKRLTAPP